MKGIFNDTRTAFSLKKATQSLTEPIFFIQNDKSTLQK
jgi:hypothetical protein